MSNTELPKGWEWKKLGEVAGTITKGTTPTTHGFGFRNEGINFVKIENVKNGKIQVDTITQFIDQETNEFLKRSILQEQDILFSIAGTIGEVAIVSKQDLPANTNQAFAIIRDFKGLIPEFLSLILKSNVANNLKSKARGVALSNVSLGDIKEAFIPLPPPIEQRRIVAKIDAAFTRLDEAIQFQKQNLDRTAELKKSVLEEVFGKGEWEIKKLGEVAEVSRGKSKHRPRNDKSLFGGKYPFIQTGDVRNAQKYIFDFSETYNEKGLAQSKLWKKGTICLTIAANIGDVAILGIDACFPDSVVGIYSESNDNNYIYYYLTTLKSQFEAKATQAAQMNLNIEKIVEFGIPIPPLPEQQQIVAHLDRAFTQIDALHAEQTARLQHLESLKSSILAEAFQGKL